MARAPITATIVDNAGNALSGRSVEVRRRADNALATVYSAETGAGTISNPLTTDTLGRVPSAFLDRGAYKLTISGAGIVTYVENFDAAPGADGSVDTAWAAVSFLPIGSLMGYGGSADPAGGVWLLANGRALSRTTYASLFGVLGTAYGAGDGSTTFLIPNTAGRSLVGSGTAPGAAGATAKSLGGVGGEETHTLSAAASGVNSNGTTVAASSIVGSHSHQPAETAYPFAVLNSPVAGAAYFSNVPPGTSGAISVSGNSVTGGTGGSNGPVAIPSTGLNGRSADSAHNNLPPFVVTNYIIRAL